MRDGWPLAAKRRHAIAVGVSPQKKLARRREDAKRDVRDGSYCHATLRRSPAEHVVHRFG